MQIGFYFDQSRCIGCFACVAACRSWNEIEPDQPDLITITSEEKGEFPNVSLKHLFITCFHCKDPNCVEACPEHLFVKRADDGVVVIDNPEMCTQCEQCVDACPYRAPKVVSGKKATILKCNMCLDRMAEGKTPACVATCPTEALDAGPIDKLMAKYGQLKTLEGFADYTLTKPSAIFRPR